MRDGILKPELDACVADLARGAPWEVAVMRLARVDPKVVEANKPSILRIAGITVAESTIAKGKKADPLA